MCCRDAQDQKLYYFLLQHPKRTLIFVNAISTLNKLTTLLQALELPVVALHANMQQRQRLKNLDRFKASDNLILVVRPPINLFASLVHPTVFQVVFVSCIPSNSAALPLDNAWLRPVDCLFMSCAGH